MVIGQVVDRVLDFRVVRSVEFLAELGSTGGADFDALAAGDTVGRVDMGAVRGSGHVRGVEQLRGAETVAGPRGAVADADDALGAVDVDDLVDKALLLGAVDDLQRFVAGDVVRVFAGGDEEFRDVSDTDAHVAFDVADAFATDALRFPAGTDHGAEGVIFVQPVGEVLDADLFVGVGDGLLDGDDVHADAGTSRRHELRGQFQRLLGSEVEHGGHFGVVVRKSRVFDHVFTGTDDPFRDGILDAVVFVVPVLFDDADPEQVVDDFLGLFDAHVVLEREPGDVAAFTAFLEAEHEFDLVLRQKAVEDPEIHMVLVHAAGQFARDVVGDQLSQFDDEFFLLRVITVVGFVRKVKVADVDPRVYFLWHNTFLLPKTCCQGARGDMRPKRSASGLTKIILFLLMIACQ